MASKLGICAACHGSGCNIISSLGTGRSLRCSVCFGSGLRSAIVLPSSREHHADGKLRIRRIKMCCDNSGETGEPDGVCPDCGEPTVEGNTKDHCNYSPIECNTCGWAPCDGSC